MKNKELKNKVIKEAYGESYNKFTIDDNGWVIIGFCCNGDDDVQELLTEYDSKLLLKDLDIINSDPYGEDGIISFRPKSLDGLETNNGWIKIEDAFPENDELYLVISKKRKIFNAVPLAFKLMKVTHWQPIILPTLPLI